ncbi:ABC1-domain-containing protein [Ramaria rubella]|nr:ABC1-domain-containing protein [Ramaria rubella]
MMVLPHFHPVRFPISLQRHISNSFHESPPIFRAPNCRRFFFTTHVRSKSNPDWRLPGRLLLLVPIAGIAVVYLSPRPKSIVSSFFSSPTIIPCTSLRPSSVKPLFIHSPYEYHPSLWKHILRSRILELILTVRRFLYLCFLFVPVLVSAPMLLIGAPGSGETKQKRNGNGSDRKLKRRRLKLGEGEGERWGAVWWYDYLVRQMQRAGPTFIKLAQWAASRADLFPDLLCDKMGMLHSNGKPHSLSHTKQVIETVFRRPFTEVFEEFEEKPIGIGAIAQVYRAKLRGDLLPPSYLGPKRAAPRKLAVITPTPDLPPIVPTAYVAIKIQHPQVSQIIRRDVQIISFFARFISIFPGMQWISLPEEVEVFGRMMNEQLDLRNEAKNLKKFEENFASRKAAVTFPRPLEDYSTKDILVEEYENALPLKAFLKHGGGPFDDVIAESGLDAFLKMLLLDNFVHSDLHPGNIMIKFYKPTTSFVLRGIIASILNTQPPLDPSHSTSQTEAQDLIVNRLRPLIADRAAWRAELKDLYEQGYQPELVFIDTGLVTTLDGDNRQNFLDLFRAVAEFDGYRAGKLMVERCRSPELAVDTETFALKIQHLVLSVKSKTFSLARIKISDILTDVLKAVRQHRVKMEGDFINTVISVLLLEGIGRQLDPGLDLFKSSLPILRQLGRQMTAQENIKDFPHSNFGAMLKIWVWLEARELVSSAIVNADDMIKYDWLTPNI